MSRWLWVSGFAVTAPSATVAAVNLDQYYQTPRERADLIVHTNSSSSSFRPLLVHAERGESAKEDVEADADAEAETPL